VPVGTGPPAPKAGDLLVLINNDIGGAEDVVTGTVFGLVSSALITAAPRARRRGRASHGESSQGRFPGMPQCCLARQPVPGVTGGPARAFRIPVH
jgi:hypothetical protein